MLQNLPLMLGGDAADGATLCSPTLAFLAQFGMFGSLSWFGCLSLDLYLSVTRPFTRPSSRLASYQQYVWLGSGLTVHRRAAGCSSLSLCVAAVIGQPGSCWRPC